MVICGLNLSHSVWGELGIGEMDDVDGCGGVVLSLAGDKSLIAVLCA